MSNGSPGQAFYNQDGTAQPASGSATHGPAPVEAAGPWHLNASGDMEREVTMTGGTVRVETAQTIAGLLADTKGSSLSHVADNVADVLVVSSVADLLVGAGESRLVAEASSNSLIAGSGWDTLIGAADNKIVAVSGPSSLLGGPGQDTVIGGAGFDKVVRVSHSSAAGAVRSSEAEIDKEAALAASYDILWGSVGKWARDSLGEPGVHLADIRRRLAGV